MSSFVVADGSADVPSDDPRMRTQQLDGAADRHGSQMYLCMDSREREIVVMACPRSRPFPDSRTEIRGAVVSGTSGSVAGPAEGKTDKDIGDIGGS